jgi:LysR family transcriptional regulator of gallate degradation
MLLHSDAIGLLTYSETRRNTLSPDLRIIPFPLADSARKVGVTYRRQQPLTLAQTTFLDILVQRAR